ncbi:DNA mismatch repair endonuclease MutL [Paenibacillus sp. SC116]|uniref:DNA mismatch repair endonuclease MutL n=1 Tax=Paenibacillus sp. SC116 TaxID=2968986 RepID=UPI00215AA271|nr:DNA mismatch repair endonuclease MutL [Paenibacillus sp. SC116]MCR8842845.1 DNA mismatch repair endonuclease MutL [Paenibacillus sp. SC116]
MGIIQVMDEQLANQIAAGEVVERPASVVKELVENAIDAGAKHIDVNVEEGGLQLIQVKDNGSGIQAEDVETAFERHATSKIRTNRDLFAIRSLGFRGEALPSIAAVSKVEVVTSSETTGLGRRFVIEGGQRIVNEDMQSMQGTVFTIRELFYNTPARLKYMKSIQTELGHISDYLYRMALAYPNIGFTLKHNGNSLLQTVGNGDLLQVIAAIYGVHTAKQMVRIEAEHLDYRLEGYVGKPELTRSNRNAMSWFVNGRYVRSFPLNQAVLRAYHTLLPINRYPLLVMQVAMHPTLVDVNVHPSKMEVRFSKEAELVQFVEQEIRDQLLGQPLIPLAAPPKAKVRTMVEQVSLDWTASNVNGNESQIGMGALSTPPEPTVKMQVQGTQQASLVADAQMGSEPVAANEQGSMQEIRRSFHEAAHPEALKNASYTGTLPDTASARAAEEHLQQAAKRDRENGTKSHTGSANEGASAHLGVNKSYYDEQRSRSAANGSHIPSSSETWRESRDSSEYKRNAAHPSNKLSNRDGTSLGSKEAYRKPSTQTASWNQAISQLPADEVSLPAVPALQYIGQVHGTYLLCSNEEGLYIIDQHAAHERVNYERFREKFAKPEDASQELLIPLTIEFTPNEAKRILERMPMLEQVGIGLEPFGQQTFLVRSHPYWFPQGEEEAIIQEMIDWVLEEKAIDIGKIREAAAIMCSCKASIKANQRITELEVNALLAQLGACIQPYTCPHGRPIIVKFTTTDLEKMFKRIM